MKKQEHTNFITAALFFGIVCTFMIYFGLTAVMSESSEGYDIERDLNRAVFQNEDLNAAIKEIDFRLFDRVDNDNVIIGSDGFLFERTHEKNGYSYLLDYQGELSFSREELETIKNNIELRREAYKNAGASYLCVFVPNSQTVYSEKMPFYYGAISENTRLRELASYLEAAGISDCFLDATGALIKAKGEGQLYNNTENSLNALGAYTVYRAVLDKLSDAVPKNYQAYLVGNSGFYSHLDSGRAIARSAGIQNLVKNLTVSLTSPPVPEYSVTTEYESFFLTKSLKRSNASVLIDCNEEWNRIIMQPYFSNTFETVAYKDTHMFSLLANEETKPDIVIQFVYEYELSALADPAIALTYGAGFEKEGNVMLTKEPTLLGASHLGTHSICLFGITEAGSSVFVSGEGIKTESQFSPNGMFFINVDIPADSLSLEIKISAKFGAKKASTPLSYVLASSENAPLRNIAVGMDSQIFGKRYSALDFESAQAALMHIAPPPNMSTIRKLTGKDTQYVCAVVPTKLSVYGDAAPQELLKSAQRLEAIRSLFSARDGKTVKVADLTDDMQKAEISRLYRATDNLPTDMGAYEIYLAVLSELGLSPKITEDKLSISDSYISGGIFVSEMGLSTAVICERTQKYSVSESSVRYTYQNSADTSKRFTTVNSDPDLPTAIIIYDEYGAGAVKYMVENFSKVIVYAQDDFRLSPADVEELKPDYIIKMVGEDNLFE